MELVKYHNDLNNLIFKTFGLKELDIFYTIIFKMKEKTEAKFTADEIKKLSITEKTNRKNSLFFSSLDKVFKTQLQVKTGTKTTDYNLFITKEFDEKTNEIKIKLHPDCIYILNSLMKNFTKFQLTEFLNLKSEYSKILFKHLRQFESTGTLIFLMQDFKILLDVPEKYKQGNIDQKILNPCIDELSPIFKNLKYTKERKGKEIYKIIFTWDNKSNTQQEKVIISEDEKEKTQYSDNANMLFSLLPLTEQLESRKAELEKLLKKHSFEMLKADIVYTIKKNPKDFWAYFIKSTQEGHFSKADIEKEKKKEEIKKARQEKEAREKEEALQQEIELEKESEELAKYVTEAEKKNIEKNYDRIEKILKSDMIPFDKFVIQEIKANPRLLEKLRERKGR